MEQSAQLADVKLASKCPPASNYSYPRGDPVMSPRGQGGRASVGSDSSVPSMVEDHGSEASLEDDYQHHAADPTETTEADLWNSFWQLKTRGDEAEPPLYPALIPSPATPRRGLRRSVHVEPHDRDISPTRKWTPAPPSPAKPRAHPPARASYSLFPPAPKLPRPTHPPRTASLPDARPGQPEHAQPAGATTSAPVSPVTAYYFEPRDSRGRLLSQGEAGCGAEAPRRKPAAHSRSRSTSRAMNPLPPVPELHAVKSTANIRGRSVSTPKSHRLEPLPRAPQELSHIKTQTAPARAPPVFGTPNYKAPASAPPTVLTFPKGSMSSPRRAPKPPHVSVFETDSDSDEDGDDKDASLARRLVRGLVHKRSVSETKRCAMEADVAMERLRRARAETAAAALGRSRLADSTGASAPTWEEKPRLRRKESAVLGRMFARLSH